MGRATTLTNYTVAPSGCWEWKGYKNRQGYGKLVRSINGRRKDIRAHRFFYEAYKGPIPEGLIIMHTCDNPSCVNPAHLQVGTHTDNIADRCAKGRTYAGPKPWAKGAHGEKHGQSKITWETAKTIRHLYFAEQRSQVEISRFYGLAFQTISKICNKTRWARP